MKTQWPDKEEYYSLLDECCKVAGQGDCYWNERFLSALERRGLTLAVARHPNDRDEWYPYNRPLIAPSPYGIHPHAWPINSMVVWQPNDNH